MQGMNKLMEVFNLCVFYVFITLLWLLAIPLGMSLKPTVAIALFVYLCFIIFRMAKGGSSSEVEYLGIKVSILYKVGAWLTFIVFMAVLFVLTSSPIVRECPGASYGSGDLRVEYYYSPMCLYCRLDKKAFHGDLPGIKDLTLESYDIRACEAKALKRKVVGVPAYIWVRDGEVVEFHPGPYGTLERLLDDAERLRGENGDI